jgi:hypothetical protein
MRRRPAAKRVRDGLGGQTIPASLHFIGDANPVIDMQSVVCATPTRRIVDDGMGVSSIVVHPGCAIAARRARSHAGLRRRKPLTMRAGMVGAMPSAGFAMPRGVSFEGFFTCFPNHRLH